MSQNATHWKRKTVLFLTSQAITLFGSSLVQFAIIWHVTLKTSSGLWVTLLTLCAFLPQMLVSLFAGVWADRASRKMLIILADAGIALATLALVLLLAGGTTDLAQLVAMAVISAIRSLGSGVQTPAVSAVIPQLAPEEKLPKVNGFFAGIQSLVQLAAPAAAGAILAFGSIQSILVIDIVTAALGIGLLAALKLPRPSHTAGQNGASILADMRAGLRYASGDPFLRKLLLIYGAFIFLSVPSGFLATLMVERTFGPDYFYLSTVEILGFAGSALGGLLLGLWGGFQNRNKTLVLGLGVYGLLSLAIGLASNFWVFAALMFLIGLAIPVTQTTVTTLVQEKTNPAFLGRVFSLIGVMFSGFMPLGMLLFGPLADVVPVQWLVMACSVPMVALAITIPAGRGFYRRGLADKQVRDSAGGAAQEG